MKKEKIVENNNRKLRLLKKQRDRLLEKLLDLEFFIKKDMESEK